MKKLASLLTDLCPPMGTTNQLPGPMFLKCLLKKREPILPRYTVTLNVVRPNFYAELKIARTITIFSRKLEEIVQLQISS